MSGVTPNTLTPPRFALSAGVLPFFCVAKVTPITLGGLKGKLHGITFNPSDSYLYGLNSTDE